MTPWCPEALVEGTGAIGELIAQDAQFVSFANPVVVPPPPPDPADLAQQAISLLNIPSPALNLGPDRAGAVVHRPMWLWVDNPGNLTSTVALLGVQVTATATLTKTTWQLGEPVDKPGTGNTTPATIVCDGAGSPPPPQDELNRTAVKNWNPDCGHTFQWRSTPERTHGAGTWPVTATAQWTVNWTSNVGVTGATTLETANTTTVEVLELKTRLVDNPEAPIPGG